MPELNILVVDDQPEITTILEKQLASRGYHTLVAYNFSEGISLIHQHSFDLAILDIRLPDGTGLELFRALRDRNHDIYTIMITGNATMENAVTALNEGVNAYLIKPFSDQELSAIISQAEKTIRLKAENKLLFKELNHTKQFYENLLNSTSESILIVDLDFNIRYANRAALKMINLTEDALMNQSLQDYLEDGYKVLSHIYQQLVQGKQVAGYRVSVGPQRHDTFNAHLSADLLFGKDEHIEGIIINLSNPLINDEVLQRILRKEKLITISHLANSLNHEILNPINILSGRLQLLKEEVRDKSFHKAFDSLQRQIERILKINELLGKFNLSKEDTIPEICDLERIFESILTEKQPQFTQKNIQIKYSKEKVNAVVEGNTIQFSDAFRYLLENLCELTSGGKYLEIYGRATAYYPHTRGFEYLFTIPGVTLNNDQFFEPYQALNMESNGLLGLSMVIMQTIFTNYGASVDSFVQNEGNTLIRVRFPIIDKPLTPSKARKK